MKLDLHTHFYTEAFFQTIRDLPSEFSFGTSSSGQTIITYRGARFFGVTPAMTDVSKRLEDMDRVGIDVEVISLSTPNVFFTGAEHQPRVARMINDSYAELIARYPTRFKGFASIPMDNSDAALPRRPLCDVPAKTGGALHPRRMPPGLLREVWRD